MRLDAQLYSYYDVHSTLRRDHEMSDTYEQSPFDAANANQPEWLVSFKRSDGCTRFQTVFATCEASAVVAARRLFVVPTAWKLINAVPIDEDEDMSWWFDRTPDEIADDEYDRQKAMFNAE